MSKLQGTPDSSDLNIPNVSNVPTLEEAFAAFEHDVAAGRTQLLQRVDSPGHRLLVIAGSIVVDCLDNANLVLRHRPADASCFGEDAEPSAWPTVEEWTCTQKPETTGTWRVVEEWPMHSLRARVVAQRLHEAAIMLFEDWCRHRLPNGPTCLGAYEPGYAVSERIWHQPGVADRFNSALLDVFPAEFVRAHNLSEYPWYRLLNPVAVFRLWNQRAER